MTVLIVIETAVLIVLSVLVAGLLRSYATVLQRLHRLDNGGAAAGADRPPFRTAGSVIEPPPRRTADLGPVAGRDEWAAAHDIAGVGLTGEVMTVRTVAVEHDTVLVFLSSGCAGCGQFWEQLTDRRTAMSFGAAMAGARLLVVTKSPEQESVSQLAGLCPAGIDLILSSAAWSEYQVPGSPYVVVVDGRTGRVKGEGSGTSLSQVAGLVAQAVGDRAHLGHTAGARGTSPAGRGTGKAGRGNPIGKPRADLEREQDVDQVLLSAGIGPGHASLYSAAHRDGQHAAGRDGQRGADAGPRA